MLPYRWDYKACTATAFGIRKPSKCACERRISITGVTFTVYLIKVPYIKLLQIYVIVPTSSAPPLLLLPSLLKLAQICLLRQFMTVAQ